MSAEIHPKYYSKYWTRLSQVSPFNGVSFLDGEGSLGKESRHFEY